jgi:hypothetical protein
MEQVGGFDFYGTGCEGVQILFGQEMIQWRALSNTVISFYVPIRVVIH